MNENLDEDLTPEEIQVRKWFQNLSGEELKSIKPLWATKKEEMECPWHHPDYEEYCFIEWETEKLIRQTSNINDLEFTRELKNEVWEDQKFLNTLKLWSEGRPVDPPVVSLSKEGFSIIDGRHRLILSAYLNSSKTIISIHKNSLKEIQSL